MYSGDVLYLVNSVCHSTSFNGGIIPVTGFQVTIDKPECVNLVMPPTITIVATKRQPIVSQITNCLLFVELFDTDFTDFHGLNFVIFNAF